MNIKNFFLKNEYLNVLIIFILCILIYSSNSKTISSGDSVPNTLLAFNLLENHSLNFDNFRGSYLQSAVAGNGYFFAESIHGHLISAYPIGTSIITFPIYLVFYLYLKISNVDINLTSADFETSRLFFEKIAAVVTTSISVILFYLSSKLKFSTRISLVSTFIYAFATNTWVTNSQALWQHTAANVALLVTIYCLLKASSVNNNGLKWLLIVAGFFAGMIPGIRPTSILFTIAGLIYSIFTFRLYSVFFCIGLVSAVPNFVWNLYHFGNLAGGYSKLFNNAVPYIFSAKHFITTFLALLFSPSRGLLIFSPILIYSILGAYQVLKLHISKDRQLIGVMTIAALFLFINYSFYIPWWGGHSYGPRFMTDLLPVICYLINYSPINYYLNSFSKTKFKKETTIFLALLIFSVFVQIVGAFGNMGVFWNPIPLNVDVYPGRSWQIQDNQIERHTKALLHTIFPPPIDSQNYVKGLNGLVQEVYDENNAPVTSTLFLVPGSQKLFKAKVQNTGSSEWFGYESALQKGEARVRVQFFDLNNVVVSENRLFLPGIVRRNNVVEAIGSIPIPNKIGLYRLVFSLLVEGVNEIQNSNGSNFYEINNVRVSNLEDQPNLPSEANLLSLEDKPNLTSEANLLSLKGYDNFLGIDGLSPIEKNNYNTWRWALGSETNLVFQLPEPQFMELSFKFENFINKQNVDIDVNGVTIKTFENLKPNSIIAQSLKIKAVKGVNRIVFRYKDWNHNKIKFAPEDPRPMSVSFTQLLIKPLKNAKL